METTKVSGKDDRHKVLLYAISTCGWCRRTKRFLKGNDIEFEYVDVDLCSREDREEIRRDILSRGGELSYPATIINDKILINGFKEGELREALGI